MQSSGKCVWPPRYVYISLDAGTN